MPQYGLMSPTANAPQYIFYNHPHPQQQHQPMYQPSPNQQAFVQYAQQQKQVRSTDLRSSKKKSGFVNVNYAHENLDSI